MTFQNITNNSSSTTQANENFDAVAAGGTYGHKAPTTAGLVWGYYGGRAFGNTVTDGTVTCTASTTNYVVASRSTGAVSVATTNTNWNDSVNYYRVRLIVTGTASITTNTDYREFVSGGFQNPMTTTGDLIVGVSSGVAGRLGAGTSTYVLTSNGPGVAPTWQASASGFANPMTTVGDIIIGGTSGAGTRLAATTDGYVLTLASGVPVWAAASGGGGSLTNWVEAVNTSSPNATVPAVSFSPTNAATNVDAVFTPKGSGSVLASVPDGNSTGGNKRGTSAVDFQTFRSTAAQVASGVRSVLVGGQYNTSSGNNTFVGGGQSNTASGAYSTVAGGSTNTAAGEYDTVVGGRSNTGGSGSSSYATVSGGYNNQATGQYSTIPGGYLATTRGIFGAMAHASGWFGGSLGDAQVEEFVLRKSTSNATPIEMSADGGTVSSSTGIVLPNNSVYDFEINVVARNGTTDCASYKLSGTILRNANAASTAIVGLPTVTAKGVSAGASGWAVTATANTSLGSLAITVTGAASTSIKWVARANTVEVVG